MVLTREIGWSPARKSGGPHLRKSGGSEPRKSRGPQPRKSGGSEPRKFCIIFPNLDGQPMNYGNLMQRGFHPALKRAGIRRIRFHDLRHTFASLLISNGEDIVRVSRLMGHANASFTLNVYSHMLPREHDPGGDRLASLVFGNKMETEDGLTSRRELPVAERLSQSIG